MGGYGRRLSMFLSTIIITGVAHASAIPLSVLSPDGHLSASVALGADGSLTYRLERDGALIISPSPVGLTLATDRPDFPDAGRLMAGLRIESVDRQTGEDNYRPVHGTASQIRAGYSEMTIHAQEQSGARRRLDLIVRTYDSGLAFRMILPPQAGLTVARVTAENSRFAFPADFACTGLNLGTWQNSHEGEYDPVPAHLIRPHDRFEVPLVCRMMPSGPTIAITESDLEDYSGAYLSGRGDGGLGVEINLTPRPEDPAVAVIKSMPQMGIMTPWRVVMVADRPEKLLESHLVDDLAAPSRISDTDWIKPGKAAWDWWSGPILRGVLKPGHDDLTYKAFIDFAGRIGLSYMLIDEGWAKGAGGGGVVRPDSDVTKTAPGVDLPMLVRYAADRHVGLWLWLNWKALDAQMDAALPLYEKLGIKGIKVDFMDRQDQDMVDFYHRLLTKAAAHHLMVDLHGAYAPRGLERTYPNFMTQEGVMGAEYNKWSRRVTATHNVSLAYTRAILGPMDYTPGAFRNVTPDAFEARNTRPEVMTTRAQQLAMYVVYTSPFACLADSPVAYEELDGTLAPGTEFLADVPATWDETRALPGEFAHYVVMARRKGQTWYVGAMNDETARRISIPTDFLGKGAWSLTRWMDGATPDALRIDTQVTPAGSAITLDLASGGGAALRFAPAH